MIHVRLSNIMKQIQTFVPLSLIALFLWNAPLSAQTIPLANWQVPSQHLKPIPAADLSSGAIFIAIAPCRLVDTRNAVGPYGGPGFSPNETRTYSIPQSGCTGIPAAAAYSMNFTIANYGANGFITAYPAGTSRPFVSTV